MKVLTIKQPWATLIMQGDKRFEFRSWQTKYRGDLLIHAGKGIDKNGMKLAKGILRESGKLIIVLNDNDIKEMIRMSENGEKATVVLERKLDGLLTTLEK